MLESIQYLNFLGAKYLVFVFSRSLKIRELSFAQFVYFLRKVCLFFKFLCDKIYNYVLFDVILNFYYNWKINTYSSKSIQTSSLVSRKQEGTKSSYFAPRWHDSLPKIWIWKNHLSFYSKSIRRWHQKHHCNQDYLKLHDFHWLGICKRCKKIKMSGEIYIM